MGTEDNRRSNTKGTGDKGTSAKNTSSATSKEKGTGAGGTGAGAGISEKAGKLPLVEPPIIINVPGSEAPAAPKRSHKKKVAPEPKDLNVLEQNITTVGNAAFGMVGLATGSPHIWTLYPGEMEGVAAPAARIIDRAGATESTNKYTDYIMLFGAVALIVLPRIMEMRKMKPLPVIKEEANVPTRETKGSNGQVVQPDPGTISSDRPNLPEYLYDNN